MAGVLAAAALILAGLYVIRNIAEERKYDRIREELDKEFGQNKVSPEKAYTPLSDEETAEYVNEEEYSFLQNAEPF